MHAYSLKIPEQATALAHAISFEANDDEAAIALVRNLYSELDSELWREDRLVRSFERPEPTV